MRNSWWTAHSSGVLLDQLVAFLMEPVPGSCARIPDEGQIRTRRPIARNYLVHPDLFPGTDSGAPPTLKNHLRSSRVLHDDPLVTLSAIINLLELNVCKWLHYLRMLNRIDIARQIVRANFDVQDPRLLQRECFVILNFIICSDTHTHTHTHFLSFSLSFGELLYYNRKVE